MSADDYVQDTTKPIRPLFLWLQHLPYYKAQMLTDVATQLSLNLNVADISSMYYFQLTSSDN